jgi:nucleotide-binding universal stress UspA family protein
MLDTIVLAVDASDYSAHATPVAIELATKFRSEVIVAHVYEQAVGLAGIYELETPQERPTSPTGSFGS